MFICYDFFVIEGLYYGSELSLGVRLYAVDQGTVVVGIIKLTISFQEILLSVQNDYFGTFICRFNNDVGILNELAKSYTFLRGEVICNVCHGSESTEGAEVASNILLNRFVYLRSSRFPV